MQKDIEIIKSTAPFWTERRYRLFMSPGMDEAEFALRLHKAFEAEVIKYPDLLESIFRGENELLVRLVADEYAFDLQFQKEEQEQSVDVEGELERERWLNESFPASTEEEISDEDNLDEDLVTEELEDFLLEEDDAEKKKEERAKRAAFSKRRNEQYMAGNAESDKRHWDENRRQELMRLLNEERERVKRSYENGYPVPIYSLTASTIEQVVKKYAPIQYESEPFNAYAYLSNSLSYKPFSYDEDKYIDNANKTAENGYESLEFYTYRKSTYNKDHYSDEYSKNNDFTSNVNDRYKEQHEKADQEYYRKLKEAENYESKNIDGHFSFDEREDKPAAFDEPEYKSPEYQRPLYERPSYGASDNNIVEHPTNQYERFKDAQVDISSPNKDYNPDYSESSFQQINSKVEKSQSENRYESYQAHDRYQERNSSIPHQESTDYVIRSPEQASRFESESSYEIRKEPTENHRAFVPDLIRYDEKPSQYERFRGEDNRAPGIEQDQNIRNFGSQVTHDAYKDTVYERATTSERFTTQDSPISETKFAEHPRPEMQPINEPAVDSKVFRGNQYERFTSEEKSVPEAAINPRFQQMDSHPTHDKHNEGTSFATHHEDTKYAKAIPEQEHRFETGITGETRKETTENFRVVVPPPIRADEKPGQYERFKGDDILEPKETERFTTQDRPISETKSVEHHHPEIPSVNSTTDSKESYANQYERFSSEEKPVPKATISPRFQQADSHLTQEKHKEGTSFAPHQKYQEHAKDIPEQEQRFEPGGSENIQKEVAENHGVIESELIRNEEKPTQYERFKGEDSSERFEVQDKHIIEEPPDFVPGETPKIDLQSKAFVLQPRSEIGKQPIQHFRTDKPIHEFDSKRVVPEKADSHELHGKTFAKAVSFPKDRFRTSGTIPFGSLHGSSNTNNRLKSNIKGSDDKSPKKEEPDSFRSPEKAFRRAKEKFQRISEQAQATSKRLAYAAGATGFKRFTVRTGRALALYARRELQNSDDLGATVTAVTRMQRYKWFLSELTTTPFMTKINRNASLQAFTKSKVRILGTKPSKDLKEGVRVAAGKQFKKLQKSKKSREHFLESCFVFDYSSKKIQNELTELSKLERRGKLTEAQAKRLSNLRNGLTKAGALKKYKDLLKKKKKGLLTLAEEVQLNELGSVKEVLMMGKKKDLRRFFVSITRMSEEMMQKSEDTGMQGMLRISHFSTNRYTRRTVRESLRFSKFVTRTTGKVLKKGGVLYLEKTKSGKAVKKAALITKDLAVEKTRRPIMAVKKGIESLANSKFGVFVNKSTSFLRAPFKGKVSDAIKRVTNIITKPLQWLSSANAWFKKIMAKIGLALGGILLMMVLWILIVDIIAAVFTVILEDEGADGKISLAPYSEALEEKSKEFTSKVKSYASGDYDRIYYDLSPDDNTKEILSMMAVKFEQNMSNKHTKKEIEAGQCDNFNSSGKYVSCLGHREAAIAYVKSLYDSSHVISVSESLPYNCGKTSTCTRRVAEIHETVDEEGNVTRSITYKCPGTHVDATISSSVLHFDELFMVDGGGGNYGNAGAQPLAEGETLAIPAGLGKIHTYMGWHTITNIRSDQYRLKVDAGENYDREGFARIGDRYVIACTSTYGKVGDYVDFYQKDGSVLKCIIGDIKNQDDAGCNKWGHMNGECIIEFVVNGSTWYHNGSGSHSNPGTSSCHPEWNQELTKAVNRGNYWRSEPVTEDKKEDEKEPAATGTVTEKQQLVANNARNGISTRPATLNYCAAWVSGVYEASGLGYPGGDAIDFWNNWKSSGSTSMNNIPVGAAVVGSGSGPMGAIYGHVGIYIGNNQVAENIGRVNICSLDEWAAKQTQTCQGKKGFIGWVWPGGNALGTGTDGSFGTSGYTDFTFWDDFHKEWAKNILNERWEDIYTEFGNSSLDWSKSTVDITNSALEDLQAAMESAKGKPYKAGASGPDAFDCSGLIKYVYEKAGIYNWGTSRPTTRNLPGSCVEVKEKDASFGDLVIWSDSNGPYHVGIYCEFDKVFEASVDHGVRKTEIYSKEQVKFYRLVKQ